MELSRADVEDVGVTITAVACGDGDYQTKMMIMIRRCPAWMGTKG